MSQFTNFLSEPVFLGLVWSILALGTFVAYRVLDIADLSLEGVFPLSAVLGLWCINSGMHPILALIISILVGIACGIITACLHVFLKIPTLLSGIIMMTGLFSFVVVISLGNISIGDKPTIFTPLNDLLTSFMGMAWGNWLGSTILVLAVVIACLLLLYFFFGTTLGISIRATGKNKMMARACGINDGVMIIIGLAISSGLVALSGGLLGQYQSYAASTMGKGTVVIGLATLFLGEVVLRRISFKSSLISVVIGGFIYWYIIDAVLIIPGFNANFIYLIQAIIMVLVMAVPVLIKRIQMRRLKIKRNREEIIDAEVK